MKIRTGFVSNSSSSSYVCDVSGEAFEVYDGCFWDAGLAQCTKGHIFRKEFLVEWERPYPSPEEMLQILDEKIDSKRECANLRSLTIDQLKERFLVETEGYPTNQCHVNECPVCTMTYIKSTELVDYLLKQTKQTREEILMSIRRRFSDYNAFKRFISNQ